MKLYIKFIFICFILSLLLQTQFFQFKFKHKSSIEIQNKLNELGKSALVTNDVPVASIVVYDNEIIGEGYNTVNKNKHLGNHAEINAISDAFKKFGANFNKLDRSKLALYSTFEPCEMCKGAMLHYNIKNVFFEQKKPMIKQIKSTLKSLKYEFSKKRFDADSLQEKLFLMHPSYKNSIKK